jgi:hypothetical protein
MVLFLFWIEIISRYRHPHPIIRILNSIVFYIRRGVSQKQCTGCYTTKHTCLQTTETAINQHQKENIIIGPGLIANHRKNMITLQVP